MFLGVVFLLWFVLSIAKIMFALQKALKSALFVSQSDYSETLYQIHISHSMVLHIIRELSSIFPIPEGAGKNTSNKQNVRECYM